MVSIQTNIDQFQDQFSIFQVHFLAISDGNCSRFNSIERSILSWILDWFWSFLARNSTRLNSIERSISNWIIKSVWLYFKVNFEVNFGLISKHSGPFWVGAAPDWIQLKGQCQVESLSPFNCISKPILRWNSGLIFEHLGPFWVGAAPDWIHQKGPFQVESGKPLNRLNSAPVQNETGADSGPRGQTAPTRAQTPGEFKVRSGAALEIAASILKRSQT